MPQPVRATFPNFCGRSPSIAMTRGDIILFHGLARHDTAASGCRPADFRTRSRLRRRVLDPLGLGTLVHAVLADLATGKDDSRAAVESLVRRHACVHFPSAVDGFDEATNLIAGLTQTPRWADSCSRKLSIRNWNFSWRGLPDDHDKRQMPTARLFRALSIACIRTRPAIGGSWTIRPIASRRRRFPRRLPATKCRCSFMPWRWSAC